MKGFTLIELLLVIVIISLAAAVAIPNVGSGWQTTTLNSATRDVMSALRYARGHALSHHKETVFLFDLDKNQYELTDKKQPFKLNKEIEVTLDIAESEMVAEKRGGIRFFADGSATGGRITLELSENKRQLDINWLTGHVQLEE